MIVINLTFSLKEIKTLAAYQLKMMEGIKNPEIISINKDIYDILVRVASKKATKIKILNNIGTLISYQTLMCEEANKLPDTKVDNTLKNATNSILTVLKEVPDKLFK